MDAFIDASAIVAMITREPEAIRFGEIVSWNWRRFTSAIAVWESVRAVARVRGVSLDEARLLVRDFIEQSNIEIVAIGAEEAELALDAHSRFGKGVHPAELNMGDCFAYACASRHNAAILFKGDDFVLTDLPDATLV